MIESKQVEYAKELDDALALVVELVKDLKAKKSVTEIAAENLPNLMSAFAGIEQVGAELAANKAVVFQTVGYRTGELAGALIG
jgi:hypothetical protein